MNKVYQVLTHACYPVLVIAFLLATMPSQSTSAEAEDAVVELDETDNVTDSNDTGETADINFNICHAFVFWSNNPQILIQ